MPIVTRTGKGSKLTIQEMDGNLEYLVTNLSGSSSITGSIAFETCYAYSQNALAHGDQTNANVFATHAEGYLTNANSTYSHAEGVSTTAAALGSHTEGQNTATYANYSHAEGTLCTTYGDSSHAEGFSSTTYGNHSHTEGIGTSTGTNLAISIPGISGGVFNTSNDVFSVGDYLTLGNAAAQDNELITTQITDVSSSIVGGKPVITVTLSDSEIELQQAVAVFPNAETTDWLGESTIKSSFSHTEGTQTIAIGRSSHAEGYYTRAFGNYSHAAGIGTQTLANGQTAIGAYNELDDASLFVVGNGYQEPVGEKDFITIRSTAFKVTPSGSVVLPVTSSNTPSWVGQQGEMIFGDDGAGNFVIWAYLGGVWRSGSLS
jgi:trimeric autotransporter adhesin